MNPTPDPAPETPDVDNSTAETAAPRPADDTPIRATPRARQLARRRGISLKEIADTIPHRAITAADVPDRGAEPEAPPAAPQASIEPQPEEPANWMEWPEPFAIDQTTHALAERNAPERDSVPTTLISTVDATDLVEIRTQFADETGQKFSYNAFMILAIARALRELPQINLRLTPTGVIQMQAIHVGWVIDTEEGILIPVIQDADRKALHDVDAELHRLALDVHTGALPIEPLESAFSLINLGVYGVDTFTPHLAPSETASLGIGRIAPRPAVVDNQIVIRHRVTLSLAFDLRLLDSPTAARFLQRIAQFIEHPLTLLLTP